MLLITWNVVYLIHCIIHCITYYCVSANKMMLSLLLGYIEMYGGTIELGLGF